MREFLVVFGVVTIGFIIFIIYFVFKVIEFVLVAVRLYRKMVRQQEAIVRLLLDIRDNIKNYMESEEAEIDEEGRPLDVPFGVARELGPDRYTESEQDEASPGEGQALDFCFHCEEEVAQGATRCPRCGKRL